VVHDRALRRLHYPAIVLGSIALAVALGGLAGVQPFAALALSAGALLVVAIARSPHVATLAFLAILYSNAAVVAVNVHGAPRAVALVVPGLLLAPLAHFLVVRREPFVVTAALPFILAFFAVQVVGVMLSSEPATSAATLGTFALEGLALYVLVTNTIRTPDLLRSALWVLVGVGGLLGGVSLLQYATGDYSNTYFGFARLSEFNETLGQPRAAGSVGEQNRYAQVLVVLLPLALSLYQTERSLRLRLLAACCGTAILFGIVLTFSRGGALAVAATLLCLVLLREIRLRQLAVVAGALAALFLSFPQYQARLLTLGEVTSVATTGSSQSAVDSSVRGRAAELLAAGAIFADHPVLGVGPGLYPTYYPEYAEKLGEQYSDTLQLSVRESARQSHDLYLQIASEEGVLGLLAFGAVLVVTFRGLLRARRRWSADRPDLAPLATGLLVAVIAYLTSAVFLHLSYIRYFWLLMAIAGAAEYLARRSPALPPRRADRSRRATE
jgi:O-antigen ligase